jgi:hypothetical protein
LIDPVGTLSILRTRLTENGAAFIEVPDCDVTPYDLIVADHLLHFTRGTLGIAVGRAGYHTLSLSDAVMSKELSWLGNAQSDCANGVSDPVILVEEAANAVRRARRDLAWLRAQLAAAEALATAKGHFGIFGTSISGTWLCGAMREHVAFFVDEDPGRIGRFHMGLPILAPLDIPAGADLFVPLIPVVAATVARRWAHLPVRIHQPPPLESMPPAIGGRTVSEERRLQ